jgi:hypothetical protein
MPSHTRPRASLTFAGSLYSSGSPIRRAASRGDRSRDLTPPFSLQEPRLILQEQLLDQPRSPRLRNPNQLAAANAIVSARL